jgi:Skp family chaperone for outer membrane proteins
MDFKTSRIKQIKTALETLRERFQEIKTNEFKEIEDLKILSFVENIELLEGYFESLAAEKSIEIEELKEEFQRIKSEYEKLKNEKNKLANIRINSAEWVEFQAAAEKKGLSSSALLRLFIKKFNEDSDIITEILS